MRVLIVSSGHAHSTFDIGAYYHKAMLDLGVDVRLIRFDLEFKFAMDAIKAFRSESDDLFYGEAVYLASRAVMSEIAISYPDLILIVTGLNLHPETLQWIRRFQQRLKRPPKTGMILTESPYVMQDEISLAKEVDFVLTNDRSMLSWLRPIQRMTFYMPHAYREGVHYKGNREKDFNVFFCGSGHAKRLDTIASVGWKDNELYLTGYFPTLQAIHPHLEKFYHEELVPNAQVADYYRRSKICLNVHRVSGRMTTMRVNKTHTGQYFVKHRLVETTGARSVNNRAIEVAACGAFQLVDGDREELEEIFGDSVAVFSSPDELEDKVGYYMSNDVERERMATISWAAVQGRTYKNNAAKILQIADKM